MGEGVDENLKCLKKSGLEHYPGFEGSGTELSSYPLWKVVIGNEELAQKLNIRTPIPRTSLLSLYAVNECLQDFPYHDDIRLGFASATTVGGMPLSESFFKDYVPYKTGRKRDIIYHTCGSATELTAKYLPPLSYITTINTACSSSANAMITAARKIKQGQMDAAIAGGSDALCWFTINGFNSLMILDSELCRPFDQSRAGLNLGEGAGYVLLVSEELADRLSLNPLAELCGYGNSNDAFHATALSESGEGPFLAMSQALNQAQLLPGQIDYINLHGTGTQNNDLAEGNAIKRLFGEKYPALSSTKAYTGHTLGASGGIEAVYSVLSIQQQLVFPNLRFANPMLETQIIPVQQVESKQIDYVMSNSFGFGGNCSSLIFAKCK